MAFSFGDSAVLLSWKPEPHLGETSEMDGYTSDWTESDNSESLQSYQVQEFKEESEEDLGFVNPVLEQELDDTELPNRPQDVEKIEDRSLGESSVKLSSEWIRE
ncbi:hypothetical protein MARPO_0018s0006 [Marchantia polymorpha]|uniref:Uncharacterized protein n=1 Tax=Marchantia polymorpha TaxID=3197 RepID=A0A2R6XFC1_MARPO|nr:hypothetical protein MARPO_0018s0006 [Marchantia polymorpha]|eukprot:PTQ44804.1 hypothetical protein MARPO_0018s0006 [Marchantia polymorpha]